MYDSLELKIKSRDKAWLLTVLTKVLAVEPTHMQKITGWKVVDNALRLFCYSDSDCDKFPAPLTAQAAQGMIDAWLENATYPQAPDTDGSADKAFVLYVGKYPDIPMYEHYKILAIIKPVWMIFGK